MATGSTPTVVSTSPSGTEILCALGVEPAVISGSCDYPPGITDRPRLDVSRVDADSSAARDAQASEPGNHYDVDADLLRSVAPDLVLTQTVCGVCAVDEALVADVLADTAVDPDVLGLSASSLESVFECVREVGAAVGRERRAGRLVDRLEHCFSAVGTSTPSGPARPSVAVLEWLDPVHVAANWVPDLVEHAGGRYPMADPGDRSREVEFSTVRAVDPDVLVLAPCSYSAADTRAALAELTDRPGWADLDAVRNDRVYLLGGQAINRWTPRLAATCQRLASVIHPDSVDGDPLAERVEAPG